MTQLLLIGDSLVADHNWQARMPACNVINLGVPGSTAGDLLDSLPVIKRQVQYADIVMIMSGTNDVLNNNFDFINTLKKVFVQISQNYPTAEVIVSSIFPMKLPHISDYTIPNLNCHIEAFTMQTGCCFLDTHSRFKDAEQTIFQEDGVHLTDEAYEIWVRTLLEHIAFLIEND